MDTVTLAKWGTVSGRFGGYFMGVDRGNRQGKIAGEISCPECAISTSGVAHEAS
jgi:hypothetical protein